EEDGTTPKNLITVTGDRTKGTEATLFTGDSAIRSDKFVIDRQNDKFDSFGGAVAVMKAAAPVAPVQDKPPAAQDAGGLFKGISFDAGGNLHVQCEGEFRQDGAKHLVTITKNVMIRQRDVTAAPGQAPIEKRLLADEVTITLEDSPPPAAGTAAATPAEPFFSGKFKALDARGNVELVSPEQVVQCDRLLYEAPPKDSSLLQVDDPENDVRVYMREESGGTRVLCARKSLALDGATGMFAPGGRMVMLPYRRWAPAVRDKESSPGKRKE
ncbi:MAG: hypothetical protein NTW87_35800, partial [Planctomycetota bacterium]|nr:hypothetical protein [Planctomycetota bacterium]